jgi:tetratricopeptide (TPR) repeat protein
MSEFNYEIIDQYLAGELTGEELAAFEQQMQADPALANEVQLYKALGEEIKQANQPDTIEDSLRNNIAALNTTYFKPKATVVKMKKIWWLGAAAAIAAIVLLLVQPFAGEKFDNEKLFAHYSANTDELSSVQRGGTDNPELVKAAELYNSKQYQLALPLLEKLVTAYPDDKDLLLAKGVSVLQNGKAESAIPIFNAISSTETVYKNSALWFKALSLLKMNKLAECVTVLRSLSTGADRYKQAQELIKKIEKELK